MTAYVEKRDLPGMTLIGLERTFRGMMATHPDGGDKIPLIWGELFDKLEEADEFEFGWAVGVLAPSHLPDAEDGEMTYFAALVTDDIPLEHPGLEVRTLDASGYVICEHLGSLDDLNDTAAWFYRDYLPESGFTLKATPHLEVYDERFDPDSNESVVMVCAPVAG